MDSDRPSWQSFFCNCLLKRVSAEKFRILVKTFQWKYDTLAGRRLVEILLGEGRKVSFADPRLPLYTGELLRLQACTAADVLDAMLPSAAESSVKEEVTMQNQNLPEMTTERPSVEATIIQMLTNSIAEGLLKSMGEVKALLRSIIPWTTLYPGSVALGYLLSAVLSSPMSHEVLGTTASKEFKAPLGRCLSTLIAQLTQVNLQLATTLDFWQKQYDIRDDAPEPNMEILNGVDLAALSFQESVIDNVPLNTRSGLYIYLNATLYSHPIFDDNEVINYLNARYKDDISTLVMDLILASFDVLANAMYRTESSESITLLRSFLVNKLPVFLNNFAPLIFEPITIEYCISQALVRVDPAAFPSFSQMFDLLDKSGMLSEARQEFLFACALHQLIPESSIETLLGDVPMQSLPASGRYSKDGLVAQCSANPSRIEELIGELENMEGNAGEIVAALVDIIQTLCNDNDTMTLKGVCTSLSRKPQALDVIMLFARSNTFMQPLCHILDSWVDHEDQGEYQPVYDEFGSILLFVTLIHHRFKLQPLELGIDSAKSFVLKYLRESCASRPLDTLTEYETKLLGGWIRGLFETEGISDELISTCHPKEFHLLVATLFDQSLKASQAKVLAPETLRDGLEYLLEPFLLPSLVVGLIWFAHKIWEADETSDEIETSIPALQTILKPPSKLSDDSAMHAVVLSLVAKPLEDSLSYAQRQHPLRADINPLLEILKPYTYKQRHDAAFFTELENWSTTSGGGLLAAFRHTIQSLMLWCNASTTSADMSPPHYTHRQLVETLRILGAKKVLQLLVEETMAHFQSGSPTDVDIVLDIVVTMISAPQHQFLACAPVLGEADPGRARQLSLRDALGMEFAHAFELSKTDLPRATMIVRLYRRVEALAGRAGPEVNGIGGDPSVLIPGVVDHGDGLPVTAINDVLVAGDHPIVSDYLAGNGASFITAG